MAVDSGFGKHYKEVSNVEFNTVQKVRERALAVPFDFSRN